MALEQWSLGAWIASMMFPAHKVADADRVAVQIRFEPVSVRREPRDALFGLLVTKRSSW
ncbi:MAG: hypothetical protein HOV94_24980 [Saccharothrix sp.]|nr:hypothetical protein [Saccharothrix sp.]